MASQFSVAGSQTVGRRGQAHSEILAGYSHKSKPTTNCVITELLSTTERRHQYRYKLVLLHFVYRVTYINTDRFRLEALRIQARSTYSVGVLVSVVPSD